MKHEDSVTDIQKKTSKQRSKYGDRDTLKDTETDIRRSRHGETEIETWRQIETWSYIKSRRHRDRHGDRSSHGDTEIDTETQTDTWRHRQTHGDTDRNTETETASWRHRDTETARGEDLTSVFFCLFS